MRGEPGNVEVIPRGHSFAASGDAESGFHMAKLRLFLSVFTLVLLAGLVWTALQPPVFSASATVLMSPPVAVDALPVDADAQSVAIQRSILLGADIIENLRLRLNRSHGIRLGANHLQNILSVQPVADTNLVELRARGPDGELYPQVINSWIEVYTTLRQDDIAANREGTVGVIREELDGLERKIDQAREALELYRQDNEIISVERQENEVLARLDGLNRALNNAIEEEVKAGAYLQTLRAAIARGEIVAPPERRRELQALQSELRQLEADVAEIRTRYTMEYVRKQPQLQAKFDRIEEIRGELEQSLKDAREAELAAAQQARASSRQTVADLEQKLNAHKQLVSRFNRIYATHQSLAEDLASLEEIQRETQARLVQVQVRRVDKYPPVSVVAGPRAVSAKLGPDYPLLLGLTLVAALLLAILSVWLRGFLSHRETAPGSVTLSGVHLYPGDTDSRLSYSSQPPARIDEAASKKLEDPRTDRRD